MDDPTPYASASPIAALPNAPAIALRLGTLACQRFPGASADLNSVTKGHASPPFRTERDVAYYVTCVQSDGVPLVVVRIKAWQIEQGSLASPPPVIDPGEH